jgi:hypothetical protein
VFWQFLFYPLVLAFWNKMSAPCVLTGDDDSIVTAQESPQMNYMALLDGKEFVAYNICLNQLKS